MERVSCIKHRDKSSFLKVHEDYLDLLGRDFCAAVVLAVFEYWTNNEIAKMTKEGRFGEDPWFEASIPELYTEMLGMYSQKSIQEAVKVIEGTKFLSVSRPGRGQLNKYLVNSKELNKALNPDGKITVEKQATREVSTEVSTEVLPSLNNRDLEVEKELTPSVGSLLENLPEQPTHQDVINRINSEGYGLLGSGARSIVKSTDISGLTLDEATARCQSAIKKNRSPRKHDKSSTGNFPPAKRLVSRTVTPEEDWRSNRWLMEFREKYIAINPAVLDADWKRAYRPAMELTDDERVKALGHILTCEGAWVKSPYNYLADREFLRLPRPKAKSELERMMGL